MKNLFLLLCIFSFAGGAKAQILNGEFEDWTKDGPIGWTAPAYWSKGVPHNGHYSFQYQSLPIMESLILSGTFKILPSSKFLSFWYQANYPFESPLFFHFKTASRDSTLLLSVSKSWMNVQIVTNTQTDDSIYIEFTVPMGPPPDFTGGMFCQIDDISLDSLQKDVSLERKNLFTLFPNPISSHANIEYFHNESSLIHASIFNLTGREVLKLPSIPLVSGDGSIPFDCDGLPNGMYYLRFEAGGKVEMRKIIVQH